MKDPRHRGSGEDGEMEIGSERVARLDVDREIEIDEQTNYIEEPREEREEKVPSEKPVPAKRRAKRR